MFDPYSDLKWFLAHRNPVIRQHPVHIPGTVTSGQKQCVHIPLKPLIALFDDNLRDGTRLGLLIDNQIGQSMFEEKLGPLLLQSNPHPLDDTGE